MANFFSYSLPVRRANVLPNQWDLVAFALVFALLGLLAFTVKQMAVPYQLGAALPISLDPAALPAYALRTILRMVLALGLSFAFTFIFATWAAKSQRAAKIIIPLIDILQSIPVLALLSLTVVGFIRLFPNSMLGPECAAIFAIFTGQVWNMALSFYQSLLLVPKDLTEAANLFQLSAWQRFWRIEVPFATPGLLWNTMMSISGSWFFVVTSEAITVANQNILLPGIGSYISLAIQQANSHAVVYALIAMLIIILLYDQLLFRPLISWSDKFKMDQAPPDKTHRPIVTTLLQRTRLFRYCTQAIANFFSLFINWPYARHKRSYRAQLRLPPQLTHSLALCWDSIIIFTALLAALILSHFILTHITFSEISHVCLLGAITALRIFLLLLLCSCVWVPIGVWIGFHPKIATLIQPLTQFFAAFPAYLLFPIVVIAIIKYHLNVEIWTAPLMILGTQWYILFNVIAGAKALPKHLNEAAHNFQVKGWLWWRKVMLPAIFPYYLTGVITAAGGAWNASIVAEAVSWGQFKLTASGLGAYIQTYTTQGDFPRIALGIGIMSLFVMILNRLVWRPLYKLAQMRFQLD